jgi:hypothetical protein
MQIEHWDPKRDGALSESAMRRKLEDRGYVVNRYTAYRHKLHFSNVDS